MPIIGLYLFEKPPSKIESRIFWKQSDLKLKNGANCLKPPRLNSTDLEIFIKSTT